MCCVIAKPEAITEPGPDLDAWFNVDTGAKAYTVTDLDTA